MPITTDVHHRRPPDPSHPSSSASRSDGPIQTRRPSRTTSALLVPLQLFLAAGWARAGVEKAIDPTWWSGAHLQQFLDEQRPFMLPWFRLFADVVVHPLAPMVAWFVVAMQVAIVGCLVSNRHVKSALWAGIVLNLTFTMAGRVNPSAFYLVMQLALLFALSRPVSTRIAVRRSFLWLLPAVSVLPFARTLHPARVIDDPALMLSFVATLAAISTISVSCDADRVHDLARERLSRASSRVKERLIDRRTDVRPVENGGTFGPDESPASSASMSRPKDFEGSL